MKLTEERLKAIIKEELAKISEVDVAPEQPAAAEDPDPGQKISYNGMKKFAQALLAGEAIPAGIVSKAREEMIANPSAGIMAEFVLALCKSFGIDESELTRILSGVKKGL